MPKFFIDQKDFLENVVLIGENLKHLTVLRYKVGDNVIVCNGQGIDLFCEIISISKNEAILKILEIQSSKSEPTTKVFLFQGLPKSDKMEYIIQKAVELGVYEIIPVITHSSQVKLNDKSSKKVERWQKISESAAKQSGRGIIPVVREPLNFESALKSLNSLDESYVAYEKEESSKNIFETRTASSVGIFIGPEGGFTEKEILNCMSHKILPISLGSRILRTETASISAISILMYVKGEL